MISKLVSSAICLGIFVSTAAASPIGDYERDLSECEAQADMRARKSSYPSLTSAGINGLASAIGAAVAGRDVSPALSSATQQGIRGGANDVVASRRARDARIDQCMRRKETGR